MYKKSRYSSYIKPITGFADLFIIIGSVFLFEINLSSPYLFIGYIATLWVIIAVRNHFYEVQRHTRIIQVIPLIFRQFLFFGLVLYAYIGVFKQPNISRLALGEYLLFVFFLILVFKFFVFFLFKRYRAVFKGNIRNVIVIGDNEKTRQLITILKNRLDYGYNFMKQFTIDDNVDEIYFSVAELSNKQINSLIDFADNNLRELKFIPDNKDIFSKRLKYEYYDYIPVLSIRSIPLQEPINKFVKRLFDIVFASCIIVFILSWLTPILAIIIKLESKGPVFF